MLVNRLTLAGDTTEGAAAMEFPSSYIWLGNKRERVRMAGNAVTPPAARDLFACVAEAVLGNSYDLELTTAA